MLLYGPTCVLFHHRFLAFHIFIFIWCCSQFPHLGLFAGTGYLTACFALMVGPQGRAVGVEHIPELVSFSIENIQKSAAAAQLKDGSLSVHAGGWRREGLVYKKNEVSCVLSCFHYLSLFPYY